MRDTQHVSIVREWLKPLQTEDVLSENIRFAPAHHAEHSNWDSWCFSQRFIATPFNTFAFVFVGLSVKGMKKKKHSFCHFAHWVDTKTSMHLYVSVSVQECEGTFLLLRAWFDNRLIDPVIFQANIWWFHLFKYEDLLHFFLKGNWTSLSCGLLVRQKESNFKTWP